MVSSPSRDLRGTLGLVREPRQIFAGSSRPLLRDVRVTLGMFVGNGTVVLVQTQSRGENIIAKVI